MKKVMFIAAVVLAAGALTWSFAQQPEETQGTTGEMGKNAPAGWRRAMMGKERMMPMCPMHHMMMGAMMSRSIVATGDGGVIVMASEKLMKFDKDLNLVKEVQVSIDMEAMQNKMNQMMEKCPMCNWMTQKEGGEMIEKGAVK